MRPVKRKDHNFTYRGPTPEIGDLTCRVDRSTTTSHWRPSSAERELLNAGGCVELEITGHPIPPVSLNVVEADGSESEAPFKQLREVDRRQ